MEVEPQPSYSWWLNSHNKPKKSVWLQTTLADLDNKTKAMLSLIQEEADSFAKRADMYYTKRPELINLIEQFYRAHRSLAERYDHLKGETKHNAHKAVKFQDALSCKQPWKHLIFDKRSMAEKHVQDPFAVCKSIRTSFSGDFCLGPPEIGSVTQMEKIEE